MSKRTAYGCIGNGLYVRTGSPPRGGARLRNAAEGELRRARVAWLVSFLRAVSL